MSARYGAVDCVHVKRRVLRIIAHIIMRNAHSRVRPGLRFAVIENERKSRSRSRRVLRIIVHIIMRDAHTHVRPGLRFAVIENEFGEVGVDDKVLQEATDEEVIEVMNGCICCTVRGDLVQALKRLHAKIAKFDAVIIETTGLADPAPVFPSLPPPPLTAFL